MAICPLPPHAPHGTISAPTFASVIRSTEHLQSVYLTGEDDRHGLGTRRQVRIRVPRTSARLPRAAPQDTQKPERAEDQNRGALPPPAPPHDPRARHDPPLPRRTL